MSFPSFGGFPLSYIADAGLAAPDGTISIAFDRSNISNDLRAWAQISLNSVPAGAATLRVWAFEDDFTAVVDDDGTLWARSITPAVGAFRIAQLPLVTTASNRNFKMAFFDASGKAGATANFQLVEQPIDDNQVPEETFAYTSPPFLIVDPVGGLTEGATLDANEGAHVGDSNDTADLTLWTTEAADDDPSSVGVEVSGFTFPGTITNAMVGLYPWVKGTIDDGSGAGGSPAGLLLALAGGSAGNTLEAWSLATPGAVAALPTPEITLLEEDVEIVTVADKGGGLWQPVFRINPTKVDAGDFDGLAETTGLKVQCSVTSLAVSVADAVTYATMELIPGDAVGNSPLLTLIDAGYTGANGYWRWSETDAQQTANAGGNWQDSDLLKSTRPHDVSDPRRVARLWRVKLDGSSSFGPMSDWYKQPDIPAITPPETPAVHWRSPERFPAATTADPTYYGLGVQFCRSFAFCEDEPQYGIAGGDMNGLRLTDTMGASWYAPRAIGLRVYSFNSVYVDPRDRNVLLAEGSMAWDSSRNSPSYTAQIGIWRSTDFGQTWTIVHAVSNSHLEGYNQQNFCYDPATRAGAVSQRVVYKAQIVKLISTASSVQILRSANGGATWSAVYTNANTATFGEIYQLKHHPTSGVLYMATQTGLWISNVAKTAWSRVPTLAAIKCPSIDISPSGTEMYATLRTLDTGVQGVWRSANTGASWTRVYSAKPIKRAAVDWLSTPEVVYVQNNDETPAVVVNTSGDGSGTWSPCSVTVRVPGNETDEYHNLLSTRSPRNTGVAWNINNGYEGMKVLPVAGGCIINSVGRWFRTLNKGAQWADTTYGFTGANAQSLGHPLFLEHPSNPARKYLIVQDLNCLRSGDGGLSYATRQIPLNSNVWGINSGAQTSTVGGVLRSGTILFGQGHANVGQGLARSTNEGVTWTATPHSGGMFFIAAHPTSSPEAIFAGSKISKNDGQTWGANVSFGRVEAMSRNGTAYCIGGATVFKSTDWATAGTPTATPFYTWAAGSAPTKYGYSAEIIRASWAEENTIWLPGANKDLIRVRNSGDTAASAVITSFPLRGQAGTLAPPAFEISDLQPDHNDPNLVYVALRACGSSNVWRGVISGSSVTWTDITLNSPRWWDSSIAVSRFTGDVVLGSGAGIWVLPPPTGYQATWGTAASMWSSLPIPVNVAALVA